MTKAKNQEKKFLRVRIQWLECWEIVVSRLTISHGDYILEHDVE